MRVSLPSARSAGLTLLEVALAVALFTTVSLTLSWLYLGSARMNSASEEEHRATNAVRDQIAQTRLLESEGSGSYRGIDAVIHERLATPDFDVTRLTADGQPAVGQVTLLTDLDGDEEFEALVDPDGDGVFEEETSGLTLEETDSVYDVNAIEVSFSLRWRSAAGGTSQQTHQLLLARKWE
jgi:hypothetical protein